MEDRTVPSVTFTGHVPGPEATPPAVTVVTPTANPASSLTNPVATGLSPSAAQSDPADLKVTITPPKKINPGDQNVKFIITIKNDGPDAAQNVTVTINLFNGLSLASEKFASGNDDGKDNVKDTTQPGQHSVASFTLKTMKSGGTDTIEVFVNVANPLPSGIQKINAVITSDTPDPNPDNNAYKSTFDHP
jgi:uncharacterized repeat protein (TIGR01451 family)